MSNATTGIEWTESTWSPIRGCSMVSAGCTNCYAQTIARRFSGPGLPYEGLVREDGKWNGVVRVIEKDLDKPLRWRRGRRIFVNPMSDLFHESLPDGDIERIFRVMVASPHHTFQILTKRAERMAEWVVWFERVIGAPWPLPNVWLGVSVEDQAAADKRIPLLLETPAAVHFLSCEPLLGPVDILPWLTHKTLANFVPFTPEARAAHGDAGPRILHRAGVDWVIAGGESGPGARPMQPDWARSLRDQCAAAGVPFFFKQWGEWKPVARKEDDHAPDPDGKEVRWLNLAGGHGFHGAAVYRMHRVGKRAAGRLLDCREHSEFPDVRHA